MADLENDTTICGWVFFSKSNRHVTFLPDDNQPETVMNLNWKVLLNTDVRKNFVEQFAPIQTDSDAMLEGFKVKASEKILRQWLKSHEAR
jgi:hypothetical protein